MSITAPPFSAGTHVCRGRVTTFRFARHILTLPGRPAALYACGACDVQAIIAFDGDREVVVYRGTRPQYLEIAAPAATPSPLTSASARPADPRPAEATLRFETREAIEARFPEATGRRAAPSPRVSTLERLAELPLEVRLERPRCPNRAHPWLWRPRTDFIGTTLLHAGGVGAVFHCRSCGQATAWQPRGESLDEVFVMPPARLVG